MSPALQRLHQLWHRPGMLMADGWWEQLGLAEWQQPYIAQAMSRPPLDALLAQRLGQQGKAPILDELSALLLEDAGRRNSLCLALGLWRMRCPDYLLLRGYREALSAVLDEQALSQLQWLLPIGLHPPEYHAEDLPAAALAAGAAWLATSAQPALRACRLFWNPAAELMSEGEPAPVLQKLSRWL